MTDSTAVISKCGEYRYELTREWKPSAPKMCFVMLNPSTADATEDDPTIRCCIGFARDLSMGGVILWNLFAVRSKSPKLLQHHPDPVGPRNSKFLGKATLRASEQPPAVPRRAAASPALSAAYGRADPYAAIAEAALRARRYYAIL